MTTRPASKPGNREATEEDSREATELSASENADLCSGCVKCCTYITVEIDAPRSAWEYDQWIWALHHSSIQLYVENCDSVFNAAVAAGGKPMMPMADQFWGDRYGVVEDPFGQRWEIATHIEDMTPEEMARRGQEFMAKMAQQKK